MAGVAGPGGAWQQGAAFADVNNDGRPDLYVCRFDAPNLLYINQGDGTFTEEAAVRGLALKDASGMGAFCDYDRDGWLDVYVQTNVLDSERRPNGQRDRLYRNNRDGTFTDVTDRAGIYGETQGHSATWWDFDEDGWPDLLVLVLALKSGLVMSVNAGWMSRFWFQFQYGRPKSERPESFWQIFSR